MRYIFGRYTLDTQIYELHCSGEPLKLEHRVFNTLLYLLQHHNRVVTRQELFEHLWPDTFVSDAALEQCIAAARRAIGDSGRAQALIKTLRGRGYRFIAGVDVQDPDRHSPPGEESIQAPTGIPSAADSSPTQLQTVINQTPVASVPGERKQGTVLCGTLANVTRLAERLGLDALQRLRQTFLGMVQQETQHYEGILQPYTDDGFLALFGIPAAQEDHAWRALQVALTLQQRLRHHCAEASKPLAGDIALCLGLHSGTVVVGQHSPEPQKPVLVFGETTDLAVRLQSLAAPDTILASDATLQLARADIQSDIFGLIRVADTSTPITAYTIVDVGPQRVSAVQFGDHNLSPFVGRQPELDALNRLLDRVRDGQGQVVGIMGEPGMGKSRLLHEFRQGLLSLDTTYLIGHCLSYGSSVPYLPLIDLLQQHCGIRHTDRPDTIRQKVSQALANRGSQAEAEAPYLLRLIGIAIDDARLAILVPAAIKSHTFAALRQLFLNRAHHQPLIIAIENLHWIDPTSEAYLTEFIDHLANVPIFLLTTFRPGYRPQWIDKSYATQLALHRLTRQDSLTMVQTIVPQRQIAKRFTQTIVKKAQGNPLFLEELAYAAMEQGTMGESDIAIPKTLQGVLTARIDRLPDVAKRLLLTASILGREFSVRLLAQLWPGPEDLEAPLQELQRREILQQRPGDEEGAYGFKHVLLQEAGYGNLLQPHRQALHALAGQALEALYADRLEEVYDQLVYHYAQTDVTTKAVDYLAHMAARAMQEHAYAESTALLQKALEHVERLPTAAGDRRYIELILCQVDALYYQGHVQESLDLLLREQERLERLRDLSLTGSYYFRLSMTWYNIGKHEQTVQCARRSLSAAKRCGDIATLGKANYALGRAFTTSGQYSKAIACTRQAVDYLSQTAEPYWLAMAYTSLGSLYLYVSEFEPALEVLVKAENIAEMTEDRSLQSRTAYYIARCHLRQGEWQAGIAASQRALERAPDAVRIALALEKLGDAYLSQGDAAQAIAAWEQALRRIEPLGLFLQGLVMARLGEAYLMQGDTEKARHLASRGLQLSQDKKYHNGIGVAQRALGRIALARGAFVEAERYLRAALQTFASGQARQQTADIHLELARLAHAQRHSEAVILHLTEAYTMYETLQLTRFIERTAQLGGELGVSLPALPQHPQPS